MIPLTDHDPPRVGPYRLLGRLGAGGMATVYLGQSGSGRLVAVKVIHDSSTSEPEFRRRLAREVDSAKRVRGLFTAEVVESGLDDTPPWFATAYIEGPSLSQVIAQDGPMPTGQVFELLAGVAEALVAIHSAGIIHRDLKPTNVLIAADGPRVIDFGIAQLSGSAEVTEITEPGVSIGTPLYMSPEQITGGEAVGSASDIFSLGVLAYYAATGSSLFGGSSAASIFFQIIQGEPDLSRLDDPELRRLVWQCLRKRPTDRPSAKEVLSSASTWLARRESLRSPSGGESWSLGPQSTLGALEKLIADNSPTEPFGPADSTAAVRDVGERIADQAASFQEQNKRRRTARSLGKISLQVLLVVTLLGGERALFGNGFTVLVGVALSGIFIVATVILTAFASQLIPIDVFPYITRRNTRWSRQVDTRVTQIQVAYNRVLRAELEHQWIRRTPGNRDLRL